MPRLQLQQPELSADVIAQTEEDKLKQQYAIESGIINILFSGEFSKLQFFWLNATMCTSIITIVMSMRFTELHSFAVLTHVIDRPLQL
jgi:hypothetical protein